MAMQRAILYINSFSYIYTYIYIFMYLYIYIFVHNLPIAPQPMLITSMQTFVVHLKSFHASKLDGTKLDH